MNNKNQRLEDRIEMLDDIHTIAVPVGLTQSEEIAYREREAVQELKKIDSKLHAGWDGVGGARPVGQSPRDAYLQDIQDAKNYNAELQRQKDRLTRALYHK